MSEITEFQIAVRSSFSRKNFASAFGRIVGYSDEGMLDSWTNRKKKLGAAMMWL